MRVFVHHAVSRRAARSGPHRCRARNIGTEDDQNPRKIFSCPARSHRDFRTRPAATLDSVLKLGQRRKQIEQTLVQALFCRRGGLTLSFGPIVAAADGSPAPMPPRAREDYAVKAGPGRRCLLDFRRAQERLAATSAPFFLDHVTDEGRDVDDTVLARQYGRPCRDPAKEVVRTTSTDALIFCA